MIRINLSPGELNFRQPGRIATEIGSALVIIVMAVYAPGFYAERLREESATIQQDVAQKQQALKKLRTNSEQINGLKSTIADLNYRAGKIRDLTKGRKQAVFVLDKLQQQHPERLWLESVTLEGELMTVTGIAVETSLISEYASRIKSLNESLEGSESDIESFVPPFPKYVAGNQSAKERRVFEQKEAVLPLQLSDVLIERTDLTEINDVSVYRFVISMSVDLPDEI